MGKKKNTEMIIILDVESETSDCSEEAPKTITRPTSLGLVEKFDKSPTGPPLCINCTIPQRKRSKMRGRKIYSSISPLCKPSRKIIDKKVPNRKQDQNSKTFPRLQPSKRIINSKIPVRKENQLDSNKFQFYLEDVLWSSFSAERKNSFAYLDCSWFPLYRKGLPKAKVLSWVRNRHIFSKKYVFVPLVCCLESTTTKPCMLLSDSLEIADPRRFEPDIRKFILDIYKVEGKPDHKKTIGKIPLCHNKGIKMIVDFLFSTSWNCSCDVRQTILALTKAILTLWMKIGLVLKACKPFVRKSLSFVRESTRIHYSVLFFNLLCGSVFRNRINYLEWIHVHESYTMKLGNLSVVYYDIEGRKEGLHTLWMSF